MSLRRLYAIGLLAPDEYQYAAAIGTFSNLRVWPTTLGSLLELELDDEQLAKARDMLAAAVMCRAAGAPQASPTDAAASYLAEAERILNVYRVALIRSS